MKYTSSLLACAFLLLPGTFSEAAAVSAKGQDNRVEWQVRSDWQLESSPVDFVHSLDGKLLFVLNNKHQVQVYNNQGQLLGRMPVSESVTGIDIAPQGETLYLVDSETNRFTSVSMKYILDIDVTGSPFKGRVDAPVTLAVFTDFE